MSTQDPILYSYLKRYQNDPKSRVFAPLAEAYRKVGLAKEAEEIAREGLQNHPGFVGGKVALARALFDQNKYEEVLGVAEPVVRDVPDNLVAQRLVGDAHLMLGNTADALSAYKMLLYFNPHDKEIAKVVFELEARGYERGDWVVKKEEPSIVDLPSQPESPIEAADEFTIQPMSSVVRKDPARRREMWSQKVETLQGMLEKVARYKERRKTN